MQMVFAASRNFTRTNPVKLLKRRDLPRGIPVATCHRSIAMSLSVAETRAIAKEAYIYGAPMEDEYRVMYGFSIHKGGAEYKGPFNSILNIARVFTPDDKSFVTPNSDTPYTFIGLDLRAEPIVISVPKIEPKRYFVFQLMDLYTYNFGYIGSRATGNDGGHYLIAGPDWKGDTPPGITAVIQAETALASVVGRTQMFDPGDLENVKKIQASYKVQPLSAFLGQPAPPRPAEPAWVKPLPPDAQRSSLEFFSVLNFILQFAPTPADEKDLRERFARLGIVAGKAFDTATLSPETTAAIKAGMADAQKDIDARRLQTTDTRDLFGTRAFMHGDYLARALGAQMGIGANSKEEAIYPLYDKDADGKPLDGANRYTLHFAKGGLPPVNAFWSLTMYGLPDQLLVANPVDRYLINSPMLAQLKTDADGGLTIAIQHDSPGPDEESNWLPAPAGPFMLALRYYLPKPELIDGTWTSPRPQRVP
jgi:hypothetical protein